MDGDFCLGVMLVFMIKKSPLWVVHLQIDGGRALPGSTFAIDDRQDHNLTLPLLR